MATRAGLTPLETDKIKVKDILSNVIFNAVKYTQQGKIEVTAFPRGAGESVQIEVMDTGVGIPREYLPVIFEPFRPVEGSSPGIHGGRGPRPEHRAPPARSLARRHRGRERSGQGLYLPHHLTDEVFSLIVFSFDSHRSSRLGDSEARCSSLDEVFVDADGKPLLGWLIDLCRLAQREKKAILLR